MQTLPDRAGPDTPGRGPALPPTEVPPATPPLEVPSPDDPDPVQPPAHNPVPPAPKAIG